MEHLFVRRYGGDDSLSVWMYVRLKSDEHKALGEASQDDFLHMLNQFEKSSHIMYGLAHSERGLLGWFEGHGPAVSKRRLQQLLKEQIGESPELAGDAQELAESFPER